MLKMVNKEMIMNINKIGAGIVTFNPDKKRVCEVIDAILIQVSEVVIVDNGSDVDINWLKEIYTNQIYIIKNIKNVGIARALNQIMEYFNNKSFEWVMTLDQDSILTENAINHLLKFSSNNVAIICPRIIHDDEIAVDEKENEKIERTITSGSLTNVVKWDNIGGFDEDLFIDMVDFDFCERIKLNGYEIIRVNSVRINHQYGDAAIKNFFGKKIGVYNYSPFRRYYITRNNIIFYKKYSNIGNFKIMVKEIVRNVGKVVLYEDNKLKKINAITKGMKDGISWKKI
ncbi:glycosyltransferase family 2 protein [Latilactobacillus sakei]|uniref:glycosyltransferase family 2 protein n=1 Tax=Latilactobacillus sakei TaxID=1599 RepID=UPI0030F096A9